MSLNDESKIPLKWIFSAVGAAIACAITVISGINYIARIEAKADMATTMLGDTNKDLDHIKNTWQNGVSDLGIYLRSIDQRLSRIEGKLDGGTHGTSK